MPYRQDLNKARQDTTREFLAANNNYSELIEVVCELTFQCVLDIERTVKLTKYQHSLLASFARSTVVSGELVVTSELVEAVTLLRKQIELLARLYELEGKDFKELSGRTPNVSGLQSKLKRLYSPFSEGAHSATYGSMALLGFYEGRERREHILYPEFTENTEIIVAKLGSLARTALYRIEQGERAFVSEKPIVVWSAARFIIPTLRS